MCRYPLFILLLLFFGPILKGQFVNIPDPNFLTAVIKNGADKNGDGNISYTEAEAVKSLKMHNCGLQDLTGIEAFIHLDTLDFYGLVGVGAGGYRPNQVTYLDVSALVHLKYLECSYNKIHTLILGELRELTVVSVGFNELTEIDVSACTALSVLFIPGNPISYLNLEQNHQVRILCIDEIYNPLMVCFSPEDMPLDGIQISSEGTTNLYMGVCDIPVVTIINDSLIRPENVEFTCNMDAVVYLLSSDNYQGAADIRENCLDSLLVTAFETGAFDLSGMNDTILWLVAIDPSGNISAFAPFFIFESPDDDPPDDDPPGDDPPGDDPPGEKEVPDEGSDIDLLLYPNPTRKIITIKTEDDLPFSFDILNDKGQLLTRRNQVASPCQLDLSELKFGMYIFRINIGNQLYVRSAVRF